MPRGPRLKLANVPFHIICRGHNRRTCFFEERDYQVFLSWLRFYATLNECEVHAYVLMTNHVHLLLSSSVENSISVLMKALKQRYAQYVNRIYNRSGSLWDGRFHSCPTQEERYFLVCQRYIELNPVRANMISHPADYRWSSYRANALGETNPLVIPHALYLALGNSNAARQFAYRELFRSEIATNVIIRIRRATDSNFLLGDSDFAQQIAKKLNSKVESGKQTDHTSGVPKANNE